MVFFLWFVGGLGGVFLFFFFCLIFFFFLKKKKYIYIYILGFPTLGF